MFLITIETRQGEVMLQHISKIRECKTIKKAWNYAKKLSLELKKKKETKYKAVITDLDRAKQIDCV